MNWACRIRRSSTEIQDLSAFSAGDDSVSRDPERTPMQWRKGGYAGFSEVKPWLPLDAHVPRHNVETQLHRSRIRYYRSTAVCCAYAPSTRFCATVRSRPSAS